MHEPDQRSAFAQRAQVTAPDGVLLLQYHSIATIVEQGQWNSLRHGHFAYYSLTTLTRLLDAVGHADCHRMGVRPVRRNGVARSRTRRRRNPTSRCSASSRPRTRWASPIPLSSAACNAAPIGTSNRCGAGWKRKRQPAAPSSRTVLRRGRWPLFSRAGIDSRLLAAVADASPAKQGRRMPGTDIPIVSPDELSRRNRIGCS